MNYLYRTMELPQLPKYDKTKYPYATIQKCNGDAYGAYGEYYYILILSTSPAFFEQSELEGWESFCYIYGQAFTSQYMLFPTKEMAEKVGKDIPVNTWWQYVDNNEIKEDKKHPAGSNITLSRGMWTNYDIYYKDTDEVWLEGESPISTTTLIKLSTLQNMAETIKDKTGSSEWRIAPNSFIDRISLIDGVIHDYEQDTNGENWLPSEVDETKLYRTPSVRYLLSLGNFIFTAEQAIKVATGFAPKLYYHFVDKLPDAFSEAYYSFYNARIHLFVIKDTGVVYTTDQIDYETGKVSEWRFEKAVDAFNVLSKGAFGGELVDGGYAPDDLSQCQPLHCYIQKIPEKIGIPNTDGKKKIFEHKDGAWNELGNSSKTSITSDGSTITIEAATVTEESENTISIGD